MNFNLFLSIIKPPLAYYYSVLRTSVGQEALHSHDLDAPDC